MRRLCLLLLLLAGSTGQADTHGYLVGDSDDSISDYQLAQMIDETFQDGSPGDGVVTSQMTLIFTQCFGGNFLPFFNETTNENGNILDWVSFTNTTAMSANEPDEPSYYGGSHVGAGAGLKPNALATDVAIEGHRTRDSREYVRFQGTIDGEGMASFNVPLAIQSSGFYQLEITANGQTASAPFIVDLLFAGGFEDRPVED